ncbi:hypothetical protein HpBT223_11580 [Helicobacter pylori]
MDQIQLSLKGIVRVLEALKFGFLKTPTRWIAVQEIPLNGLASESLKAKIQEFKSFLASLMLACMPTSKKQPLH